MRFTQGRGRGVSTAGKGDKRAIAFLFGVDA